MYTQIFLLILLILTINLAPDVSQGFWNINALDSFLVAIFLYVSLLSLIFLQNKWFRQKQINNQKSLTLFTNLELIGYFVFIYLILGVQTHFIWLTYSDTLFSTITLAFYFLGLGFFLYSLETVSRKKWKNTKAQISFLIPFLIPYFTLTVSLDICYWLFGIREGMAPTLIALSLLIICLLFLPYFIQKFWNCTPLKDEKLHQRLEDLCMKANFKHGGMNTWSVMTGMITAGIIGILPRFRYVMFTPKLLEMLAPEQIEAILAHEIGHSKHKHLLLYPLIILGMGVVLGLFFIFFESSLETLQIDSFFSKAIAPLIVFIPYAVIMWLYFRYVFGFFSRLFERQADLYVFNLDLPPENIISALDHIAIASGNIHHHPSWHHFGIQQRIDYLHKVIDTRDLINKHHRKVRVCLILYFLFLAIGIFTLLWY